MRDWNRIAPFESRLVWERREFAGLSMRERCSLSRVVFQDLGMEVRTEAGFVLGMLNPRANPPRLLLRACLHDDEQTAMLLCAGRALQAGETGKSVLFLLTAGDDTPPAAYGGVEAEVNAKDFAPSLYSGAPDEDRALALAARDFTEEAFRWCAR
ncbi:MAG: hypothetical protein IJ175_01985 [Clostridia bacterium]|nr:hypothetical protein [Clostridia bacterium]